MVGGTRRLSRLSACLPPIRTSGAPSRAASGQIIRLVLGFTLGGDAEAIVLYLARYVCRTPAQQELPRRRHGLRPAPPDPRSRWKSAFAAPRCRPGAGRPRGTPRIRLRPRGSRPRRRSARRAVDRSLTNSSSSSSSEPYRLSKRSTCCTGKPDSAASIPGIPERLIALGSKQWYVFGAAGWHLARGPERRHPRHRAP